MEKRSRDRDVLSLVGSKENTVFVGRLPRRYDSAEIIMFCSAVGPLRGFFPSGDTYAFVEYHTPESAISAVGVLNGKLLGSESTGGVSKIIVMESLRLTRLFVGGFYRGLDPKSIEMTIKSIEPVS